jgi:hypothetical protein
LQDEPSAGIRAALIELLFEGRGFNACSQIVLKGMALTPVFKLF